MHNDCPLVLQKLILYFNFYDLVKTSKVTFFRTICISCIYVECRDLCYVRKTTVAITPYLTSERPQHVNCLPQNKEKTHEKFCCVRYKALVVMFSNTVYVSLSRYATLCIQLAHRLASNCFVHILHYFACSCSFTSRKMLRIETKTIIFRFSYQSR
jgi:hypothetical protein